MASRADATAGGSVDRAQASSAGRRARTTLRACWAGSAGRSAGAPPPQRAGYAPTSSTQPAPVARAWASRASPAATAWVRVCAPSWLPRILRLGSRRETGRRWERRTKAKRLRPSNSEGRSKPMYWRNILPGTAPLPPLPIQRGSGSAPLPQVCNQTHGKWPKAWSWRQKRTLPA
jgi:hypothetical protein